MALYVVCLYESNNLNVTCERAVSACVQIRCADVTVDIDVTVKCAVVRIYIIGLDIAKRVEEPFLCTDPKTTEETDDTTGLVIRNGKKVVVR